MRRIAFRADTNQAIGSGDLVTLINLSRCFTSDGWETIFITQRTPNAVALLKKHGIARAVFLAPGLSQEKENKAMGSIVSRYGIDAIILEITGKPLSGYRLPEKVIKGCVDFWGIVPAGFDLVINWDIGGRSLYKRPRGKTIFLCGPEYAPLPRGYDASKANRRSYRDSPRRVLVTMGGVDKANLTQKVVATLTKDGLDASFTIVIGSGYRYTKQLTGQLRRSGLKYALKSNLRNLWPELMKCDVAVSAGGFTVFELLASRTPCVLIAAVGHQIKRCKRLAAEKKAHYLGFRDFSAEKLARCLRRPRRSLPLFVSKTGVIKDRVNELYLQRHPA